MALSASEESGLSATSRDRSGTGRSVFNVLTNDSALLSLSIANLCFLYVWKEILGLSSDSWIKFTSTFPPGYALILAIAADVLCLAALIFGLMWFRNSPRRSIKALARTLLIFFSAVALYEPPAIVSSTLFGHRLRQQIFGVSAITLGIAVLFLFVFARSRTVSVLRAIALILSPVFPILIVNGMAHTYAVRSQWRGNGSPAGMLPQQKSSERLIWVIFDELDRRMLFEVRPREVRLPEFDRLRAETLDASRVKSPAMNTPVAVPSLLIQKNIACVQASQKGELFFRLDADQRPIAFSSQMDVFKQARAAGLNAGVTGWMLPYGRMFGKYVSDCGSAFCGFVVPFVQRELRPRPFYQKAWYLAKWQAKVLPFIPNLVSPKPDEGRISREGNIESFQEVMSNARRMLRNRDLNLVFIHLPLPHPPGIWDPKKSALTTGKSDYLDNLQLADKVLGEIRTTLEDVGDWQKSTVLVTSDHPFRPDAWTGSRNRFESQEVEQVSQDTWFPYIPFLLKLPLQQTRVPYGEDFNSVLSSELVLNILKGQLHTTDDVVNWLNNNRVRLSHGSTPTNNAGICE